MTTILYAQNIDIINMIKILQNTKKTYHPIQTLYNPFITTKKAIINPIIKVQTPPKQNKINYNIQVIFQNKVKINNIWYKNGDKLDKYTIIIKNSNVFLKDKNHIQKLSRQIYIKVK